MSEIPYETRSLYAARIRGMLPKMIEKGGFQENESAKLLPEYTRVGDTRLSEHARLARDGEQVTLFAGPREFDPPPYKIDEMKFASSTVYQGEYSAYAHGDVEHEAKVDKTESLDLVTRRVFERFNVITLVNPSLGVCRLALAQNPPIRDVFLNVEEENRETEEARMRQIGMNIVPQPSGLAFIGREGTRHAYVCKDWIALAPTLGKDTVYELDKAVHSEIRWGQVRSQQYSYNSPFYYWNQLQTAQILDVPKTPRILCANKYYPALEIEQIKGENRFLQAWPPEEEEMIEGIRYKVRRSRGHYYDLRRDGDYVPYCVRRGQIIRLGLPLVPYVIEGRYSFTLYSLNPVPVSCEVLDYRQVPKFRTQKGLTKGWIWNAQWFEGSIALHRGYYKEIQVFYQQKDRIYYGLYNLPEGYVFFKTFQRMKTSAYHSNLCHHVAQEAGPGTVTDLVYERLSEGTYTSQTITNKSRLMRAWRSYPNAFISYTGHPVLLKWSIPELNEGARISVICLKKTVLPALTQSILSASGFSIDVIDQEFFVIRDHYSSTGRFLQVEGDLTYEIVKSQKKKTFEPEASHPVHYAAEF